MELSRRRRLRGLTQARLAALAGTSQQHVSLIERGIAGVEVATLRGLLAALGCRLAIQDAPVAASGLPGRRARWERLAEFELASEERVAARESAARVGELAELYLKLHPGAEQPLEEQGRALARWRSRLAQVRPR